MKQSVVWVHGIGVHEPGYAKREGWQATLQEYWQSGDEQFKEVCWDVVMEDEGSGRRSRRRATAADPRAEAEALALQAQLEQTIAEHEAAISADPTLPEATEADGVEAGVRLRRGVIGNAINFFRTGVSDFVRYLTNDGLREEVKGEFKEVVLPLLEAGDSVSVISHSWGTIVSYEALHDLHQQFPDKRVARLFTLGSPLWMPPIRPMLRPGPSRPGNVERWINITAHGDPVGGWLYPHFPVDRDFQAPGVATIHAHSSYFTRGNAGVMQDLVARMLAD